MQKMSNNKKHKRLYALICITVISASGCGLAPKEEVLPDAPVLQTITVEEYKIIDVMRGDLVESVTVDCTYKAFQTEKLSFNVDGLRYSHIYVEEGDLVKVGDVLADLVMDDLEQQIKDRTENVRALELRIAQSEELRNLAAANQSQLSNLSDANEQLVMKYENEITNQDNTISQLMDDLYIEQKRLDKLGEDVKNRQIIAGINGVVSSVAKVGEWELSDKEANFITLFDPDTMVFVTNGRDSELFKPGEKVKVSTDEMVYDAVVLSPGELEGIEELTEDSKEVYLRVEIENNLLQNGTRGRVTFNLQERNDTLYLPTAAIHVDNGKSVVYVEDEGGFKSVKEVETGLKADGKIEIVSGLNEGDSVIMD